MTLRTALGRVKGLGSAKSGVHHWWMQKVSGLALVPLTIWFVVLVIRLTNANEEGLLRLLASPFNTITLMLFLVICLYHGWIGAKVIIEDYVHKECAKFFLIVLLQTICIISAVAGLCAVLVFHLSLFATTM